VLGPNKEAPAFAKVLPNCEKGFGTFGVTGVVVGVVVGKVGPSKGTSVGVVVGVVVGKVGPSKGTSVGVTGADVGFPPPSQKTQSKQLGPGSGLQIPI
jgi:hypothetical protein